MKKRGRTGYLFPLYRKRTSSLFLNLYKAGITGLESDIHKIRTDIKKILAIYQFLDVIFEGEFRKEDYLMDFKGLFHHAGNLREVQINLMNLEHYSTQLEDEKDFQVYLEKEEQAQATKFLNFIRGFDENAVISKEKEIKKFMLELGSKKFGGDVDKFIRKKSSKILDYLPKIHDEESLHSIRAHLKSMASILDMYVQSSAEPDPVAEQLLTEINNLEVLIGVWHDHIVLMGCINTYRKAKYKENSAMAPVLSSLELKLKSENTTIVDTLAGSVTSLVLNSILTKYRWNRYIIEYPSNL
jgi:CHAD domain-containing protein